MPRVPVDTIRDHLKQGYGMTDYYIGLREQQAYMLCGDSSHYAGHINHPYGESDLPVYPDVPPKLYNQDRSRRILGSAIIALSRMMGSDPLPTWADVDPVTREMRQEAFQRRYREQEMQEAASRAFWDGFCLGAGFVAHGLEDCRKYPGTQKTAVEHIPATSVCWSPIHPSPVESPWLAITRWLPLEVAQAMYPKAMIDKGRSTSLMTQQMTYQMNVVRVIEYWHTGDAAYDHTYAIFAGPLQYGPVRHTSNPWEERIPVTAYVHLCPSMMQRPIGSVWLQVASQQQINTAEAFMLDRFINGRRGEILDASKIVPGDWKKWREGHQRFMRTIDGKIGDVREIYQVIPESPLEASTIQVLQYFESRNQEESGLSDLDRGAPLGGNRSATEVNILDQRAQSNQAFVARQVALMMTRFVDNVADSMKRGDTAPCEVEFDGEPITLNGDIPELTLAAIFEQDAMVKVDQDSLTSEQSRQKKRAKAEDMLAVIGSPIGQAIPPAKALEIILKNLGFEKEWTEIEAEVMEAEEAAAQMQSQAMPGMDPSQVPGAPVMAPQTPF
ncbi:MAG: hypothetical protein ACK4NQ_00100 [Fimbriimonadaceae bacterium]